MKFNVLIDDKSIDDKKNQSFNIYNSESGLIGSEKVGVIFETILFGGFYYSIIKSIKYLSEL